MWNGTRDGEGGFVDYSNGQTNINTPKQVDITVRDIRGAERMPCFRDNGFQLYSHASSLTSQEFLNWTTPEGKQLIEERYFAECQEIVERVTGASIARPYSFRLRRMDAQPGPTNTDTFAKARSKQTSSLAITHIDYDDAATREQISEHFGEAADDILARHKRYAQINVWRPIGDQVEAWPLAIVDTSGVKEGWRYDTHIAGVDAINNPRVTLRGNKARDFILKHDPAYTYHYASGMNPDEVLVFSSGDSNPAKVRPHGAFWDNQSPKDKPILRNSIEVRVWALFEADD
jgi:hypothetical protein